MENSLNGSGLFWKEELSLDSSSGGDDDDDADSLLNGFESSVAAAAVVVDTTGADLEPMDIVREREGDDIFKMR